jgi:cytochrome c biogenesis protein CcdA
MLGGLFSSPCATPVLVALLAAVARGGNPVRGVVLLLLYSIGHGALVVAAGTFMGLAGKVTKSGSYGLFASIVNGILGLVILIAGLYLIYLGV